MNPRKVFIACTPMYRKLLEAGLEFMTSPFFGMLIADDKKPKCLAVLTLQFDRYLHR